MQSMESSFILCFMLFFCIPTAELADDSDVRNLLTQLLMTNSYDNRVRPIANQSNPVNVYLKYFSYGINDVNEVEQKLSTTGYLYIVWYDDFLTWDPALFGNLKYVYIPQDSIWKPDISLQNGFESLDGLGTTSLQMFVGFDGSVAWFPFQLFESKCKLDLTYFPFDIQTCNLEFVAWSFSPADVNLFVDSYSMNVDAAANSNGQWDIVASSAMNVAEITGTKIRFSFTIRRKPLFVMMNIIIPMILLSILNIFTFQIPADTGERTGYTITVWLSFAVFLTMVSSSLPESSDTVPIVSIYIMIQLGIGTFTVIISVIESRIVHSSDDSNDRSVAWYIRRIALICKRPRIAPSEETNYTLKDGIATFDSLLFWSFSVILTLVTLTTMTIVAVSE